MLVIFWLQNSPYREGEGDKPRGSSCDAMLRFRGIHRVCKIYFFNVKQVEVVGLLVFWGRLFSPSCSRPLSLSSKRAEEGDEFRIKRRSLCIRTASPMSRDIKVGREVGKAT